MRFVAVLVHRLLDFRWEELDTMLLMLDLDPAVCYDQKLKAKQQAEKLEQEKQLRELQKEERPEDSLAGISLAWSPFLLIELPNASYADRLAQRMILLKGIYELWGDGETYPQAVQSVSDYVAKHSAMLNSQDGYLGDESKSWCVNVESFGRSLSRDQQEQKRMCFKDCLPFKGPVKLKNPDNRFWILEDAGLPEYEDGGKKSKTKGKSNSKDKPAEDTRCRHIYVVREVRGCGREMGHRAARDNIDRFSLKKRRYLGPTSMDVELALLMVNMCMTRRGDYVIDPFAGTGSVLVALSAFGAVPCLGTDIDVRVLRGDMGVEHKQQMAKKKQQHKQQQARQKKKQKQQSQANSTSKSTNDSGKNVRANSGERGVLLNFRQYSLPRPELVRCDVSRGHSCFRALRAKTGAGEADRSYWFDGICCDPPYGIRAGARKSGSKKEVVNKVPQEHLHDHIPSTQPYDGEAVMDDLLHNAAHWLKRGGRLVYWLPCDYQLHEAQLPMHPCLRLVANSLQRLTFGYGRRLITMEKICEPEPETAASASASASGSSAQPAAKRHAAPSYADMRGLVHGNKDGKDSSSSSSAKRRKGEQSQVCRTE